MASDIRYNEEDQRTKIMQKILELSKQGLTKQGMLDKLGLSNQQLREITAELADKEFLRYGEPGGAYITTDKGFEFLREIENASQNKKKKQLTKMHAST
ncbi:MAG TPA: winged helix-turn-helix domain-containing protein [Nitrososphaera sp.]|nr:winged helix-turn-helix domain-containing protein [Nitrososphaera sp.]